MSRTPCLHSVTGTQTSSPERGGPTHPLLHTARLLSVKWLPLLVPHCRRLFFQKLGALLINRTLFLCEELTGHSGGCRLLTQRWTMFKTDLKGCFIMLIQDLSSLAVVRPKQPEEGKRYPLDSDPRATM